jgi:hypothetical protein
MRRWLAGAAVIAAVASGAATSCTADTLDGATCGDGKGTWIEDESDSLKGGYTVIVRLCIDDGGNVVDLEVE